MMFTRDLLIVASLALAATMSNAIAIKSACLTKIDMVGNLTSGTGTAFDQTKQIYTSLDTESLPASTRVCVILENKALALSSF